MTTELQAKLSELQKNEKFRTEMTAARTKEAKLAILKKYGIDPTPTDSPLALSDEDLDAVAGGLIIIK